MTRDLAARVEAAREAVDRRMEALEIHEAIAAIWAVVDAVNRFIDREAPWSLARSGRAEDALRLDGVLYGALEALRNVALLASPFIPTVSRRILEQLGLDAPPEEARWDEVRWGGLPAGTVTRPGGPVFPRIIEDVPPASAPAVSSSERGGSPPRSATVTIDDFKRLDLRVAEVVAAERVPRTDRLLALEVDLGPAGGRRRLVAGIAGRYAPEDLVGRHVVVVANLEPARIRGIESRGMLLAADAPDGPVLLLPETAVPPGTRVR